MRLESTPVFHVLLEGRRMGPYDRRTIVGMRIKQTLTSEHVLEDEHGYHLTVAQLLGKPSQTSFNPNRSGSFSLVQACYSASLISAQDGAVAIPRFKGEVEARVQGDVLRMSGRFREGFGWKEDRIKIPLKLFAHARVVGARVDLWLSDEPGVGPGKMQHLALDLFTPEAAGELVEWLPAAVPVPTVAPEPMLDASSGVPRARHYLMWVALIGVVLVVGFLLLLLGLRRAI